VVVQAATRPVAETRDRWRVAQPWLSTLVRLALAAVWGLAGLAKVGDLPANVRAVRAYRLLPEGAAQVVGSGQPFVEIALAVLLVIGLGVRVSAVVSALLLLAYIGGIASAAARGLRIDCGCFSSGGNLAAEQSTQYTVEIARDVGFLVLAGLLVGWPRGRWALDSLLFPPLPAEPTEEDA
jgi:uncharacterized membrane protein YphA (DoxX/SURF4 family)